MARTKSPLLQMSGHIGKQLVYKQYGDVTIVTKYPDMSKRKLSEKQIAANETMIEANAVAKVILKNEPLAREAQGRLNVTRNKLYTSLIREYFLKKEEERAEFRNSIFSQLKQ